jgi:DNA-binding SARP family transcriptional activator
MAAHRLLTLGTLQVIDASGQPIDFPAGKPLALLIRLVVGPAAPTRRELAQLLWSRSSPERGLQSVRQALWLIRRTIGDCVVETEGHLTLRTDCIANDARSSWGSWSS